jgi:hypothetical protein
MSCGADIPPVWVAALNSNKCPGCNGPIMNEASQELLKELADALQRMPNDPQGVAGWLLSNYRFQKMGDGKPVEKFHRKGGESNARDEFDETGLKVAPSYNEFVKRNGAEHLVARGNELAAKLKGGKSGKIGELAALIQGVGDPYGDNTTNIPDDGPVDTEDQKAYLELKQAGYDPFSNVAAAPSGPMADLSQIIDPGDVIQLMKSQSEDVPLENEMLLSQTEKGRAILQMNQFKRIKAQEAVTGGGGGVFRRG